LPDRYMRWTRSRKAADCGGPGAAMSAWPLKALAVGRGRAGQEGCRHILVGGDRATGAGILGAAADSR